MYVLVRVARSLFLFPAATPCFFPRFGFGGLEPRKGLHPNPFEQQEYAQGFHLTERRVHPHSPQRVRVRNLFSVVCGVQIKCEAHAKVSQSSQDGMCLFTALRNG